MRDLKQLDAFRLKMPGFPIGGSTEGAFAIQSPTFAGKLRVIASAGLGWDHVSVSLPNRCPNWPEMSRVKDLFFHDDETVMQLHVPASDHVNNHPYCLHLWRPHQAEIPRPPALMVGIRDLSPDDVRAMSTRQLEAIQGSGTARLMAGDRP
jgi:hypothetical protein